MSFLLLLQKKFFRRFMDGRPGPWGAMAVGVFGLRTLWRWSRRESDVVYRTKLKPGESLTVTHSEDTELSLKRDRRAARRAERRGSSRASGRGSTVDADL
ncbi:MAG: hypothetical protein JST73_04025 [Actinobacteria bacterium]|nr:hypothetical protein [Actinomycetota bacterium]